MSLTKIFSREKVELKLINLAQQSNDLKVFHHHIYEYKKGIRNLILATEKSIHRKVIEDRLNNEKIDFVIQEFSKDKINVFFGAEDCVKVVKTFVDRKLNELSPEQDFMLGIMLGYDRLKQCERYLKFNNKIILFKKTKQN